MPANASFDKGAVVEEWVDVHFFRPIGLRIAKAAAPTRITPDQLTMLALGFGLLAGHLLFYRNVAINAVGIAMFLVSDFFDSADGQLARMRQSSTRFGRMLDGLSDTTRFANLYATLIARLIASGDPWWFAIVLGGGGGLLHSTQSSAVDYIKQIYLHVARGGDGELDLPEDVARMSPGTSLLRRFQLSTYAGYVRRQARLFPNSVAVVRRMREGLGSADLTHRWAEREAPVVRQCVWVAQNIRFLLLALMVVPGSPKTYLWVTIVPMTLFAAILVIVHERRAGEMLEQADTAQLAAATGDDARA